jgi:hypothetical protein
MVEEKGKVPNRFLHPFARAKYDAAMMNYDEFKAKMLSEEEVESYDLTFPESWRKQPLAWLTGTKKGLPSGSGFGLVQSPYSDVYTKMYGVVPIADLPKYRLMYRNYPDVQQAVEMQTNLAVGKGYVIKHKQKKVADYIQDCLLDIDMPQHTLTMASETLTYGNSFTEVLWSDSESTKETLYDYHGEMYTAGELKNYNIAGTIAPAVYENNILEATKVNRKPKSDLVGLKDLDPVYMRVRRDSWANVFGYIQWMSFPPVLIDLDSCIHIKNRPKSTGYESAYGISILMSLIKNTDLLNYFENDAAIWMHYKAVPPLTVKGGTPERPYGVDQMNDLQRKLKGRSAASTLFVKGDVSVEEMKTVASDLHIDWWINYLLLKRTQALGVPSFLMGQKETAGRSSAQVMILEFITRLQILQDFIARPIEKFIIRPLIDDKFGKSVPNARIVWKPIIEETPDMRPQRLIQLLQAGAVSVNEVRLEMGFEELEDSQYDKPMPMMEPAMNPSGFPAKPGALPNQQKVPQNTPESRQKTNPSTRNNPTSTMKSEKDIRKQKIYELMVLDDTFREMMSNIVGEARSNLRSDDMLIKDAKKDFLGKVTKCINAYGDATYILAKHEKDKDAPLEIEKGEGYAVEAYRNEIYGNFEKIFESMVKLKEEGALLTL